jgi:dTDP-glucose 4,6-dehydratase
LIKEVYKLNGRKLLIIGGSGFIGKSIIDAYQRGNLRRWDINDIVILSRNSTALKKIFSLKSNSKIKLINCDISECEQIENADLIIHAAASTNAKKYLDNPNDEYINNLKNVNNYIKLAKKFHKNSKILFLSSGAVYGKQNIKIKRIPEDYKNNEAINNLAINKILYAKSKIESENSFIKLAENDFNVAIARCFSFIGPFLPRDQHFAIGNFINDGMIGNNIKVKATTHVIRSYMFSDDLVDWLIQILEYSSNQCPIFNVGSKDEIEIKDLAKLIAKKFNVEIEIKKRNKYPIDIYVPCINKAIKYGLRVKYNLEEALDETIRRILSNANANANTN